MTNVVEKEAKTFEHFMTQVVVDKDGAYFFASKGGWEKPVYVRRELLDVLAEYVRSLPPLSAL